MPTFLIGAAIGGLVSGGVALATGAAFAGAFWTAFATSAILGGLSKALAKKPAIPDEGAASVFAAQGRDVSVRQPISPWKVIVGESKEGGVITAAWLSSDKQYFHVVVTLACHRCNAIGDVYLDDKIVTSAMLDGSGNVTSGDYATTRPQPWVHSATVPGGGAITVDHDVASVQSVSVQREVVLGGDDGTELQDVGLLEGSNYTRSGSTFTLNAEYEGLLCTINYTENAVASNLRIQKNLGADTYGTQPFPDFVAESGGYWTATDCQDGHTKLYLRFAVAALDGALPAISAVVQGMLHYDPRTTTTAYSANNALAVSSYLCNTEFGLGATFADEIESDALEAAANLCDESVSLAAGGTENRYTCNGSFLTSERPGDIIEKLLGSMAGRAAHISDRWHLFAGGYEAPTVTLDEKELIAAIDIDPMPDNNEWANGAKGVFVDPENGYQPTDFPAVTSATYLSQDGSVRRWADLDLTSFTNSSPMAQRLAKIELLRRRNGLRFKGTWRLSAWRALTARTVAVDFDKYGWSGQVFEITASNFVIIPGDDDAGPALGVELDMRITSAEIYDWGTDEEQAQPAAQTTQLPNPFEVPAVEAPSVTETISESRAPLRVTVTTELATSAIPAGTAAAYEYRYKQVNDAQYTLLPPSPNALVKLDNLSAGLYLVGCRGHNAFGRAGDWATSQALLRGLTDPPSDLTGLDLTPLGNGQGRLTWPLHPDADVRIGGWIDIRFSPSVSSPTWNDCSFLARAGGGEVSKEVPLRTGTYRARAFDSGGRQSETSVFVVTTEPDLQGYNAVESLTAEPDWTGTLSHTHVTDGKLRLSGAALISEMTTPMSEWGLLSTLGGVSSEGSCTFDEIIDLGAVYTSRLTLALETLSYGTSDPISQWLQPMSTWGLLSGPEVSATRCEVYVATSDDGVTYSEWSLFVIGLYPARYFKFKTVLKSTNTEQNIEVSALTVTIDMPDREELQTDIASGAGTKSVTWTLSPGFKVTPHLGITAKNMQTGDYYTVASETATGFDITFRDSGGSAVNRTFNVRAKAY